MSENKTFIKSSVTYLQKYAYQPVWQISPLNVTVSNIIVIPCYLEPNLIATLESLQKCIAPKQAVLVLIVINAAKIATEEDKNFNQKTYQNTQDWISLNSTAHLHFQCLLKQELPPKHAGVGLARKIGMDAALKYFYQTKINGLITCLDADCSVHNNYLVELEKVALDQKIGGVTIAFRHLYEQVQDTQAQKGIVHYELFLRYYIMGLRYINYPFAMHTIGSSMACRAVAYAKHGGMNRRKAGEDFYFLHKLAPHEKFTHLINTYVYPSCRTSFRVPFGTGKAQQEWLEGHSKIADTYHPAIFNDLKSFLAMMQTYFENQVELAFPASINGFLEDHNFKEEMHRIRSGSNSKTQMQAKFFQWFDGFKILKMVHFLRDEHYPNLPLQEGASTLLSWITHTESPPQSIVELLEVFREIDDRG